MILEIQGRQFTVEKLFNILFQRNYLIEVACF